MVRLREREPKQKFRQIGVVMLLACALLLGGCMHTTKSVFPSHYDLGPSAATTASGHKTTTHTGPVLAISRISVPQWLDGTAMYYRLNYRNDRQLAAYGHSDWVAPPAALLESIVQHTLAAGGSWRAVIGPKNPAKAGANLQLRLDDFSQAFSRPDDSAGVIDATATLVDNQNGQVLGQRHFHVETVAATPDAQGGAKALAEAGRQLAKDIQQWLQALPDPSREPHQP